MNKLKTILAGIDFSDCSRSALEQAVRMAQWNNARLHALHSIEYLTLSDAAWASHIPQEKLEQGAAAEARQALHQWLKKSQAPSQTEVLVDVGSRNLTGKDCQIALDEAGVTVNKNTIPFETRSPFQASGVRLGTPAVTTRGMKEAEMAAIADMISEVLLDIKNVDTLSKVRQRVRELTARFPLPY